MQKWVNIINESQTGYLNDIDNCNSQENCEPRSVLQRSKPELQPGDMIRIENVFGVGNGEGFGVFQAYSLDGDTAICNVDSRVLSFPVEFVSLSPEQNCEDKFASTGNDGSLSPMSLVHDENEEIKNIGEAKMGNLESWMHMIEQAEKDDIEVEEDSSCAEEESEEELEEGKDEKKDCDCGEYDCKTCFPDDDKVVDESRIQEVAYSLDDDSEDELDDEPEDGEELDEQRVDELRDDPAPEGGFNSIDDGPRSGFGDEEPVIPDMAYGDADAGEDVSELIGQIEYIQDMGMSNSGKNYSAELLMNMDPRMVQRIHAKVSGEVSEELGDWGDYFDNDREAGGEESDSYDQGYVDSDDPTDPGDVYAQDGVIVAMDPDELGGEIEFTAPEAPEGYADLPHEVMPPKDTGDVYHSRDARDFRKDRAVRRAGQVAKHVMPGYNESESMIKPIPAINESKDAKSKKLYEGADPDILKINDMLKR